MNMTIQQWLNTLVPMPQIVQIVDQVLPAFVIVAVMILVIGYHMNIIAADSVFAPSSQLIMLLVCIAGAPWMLGIAQQIANALVGAVASAIPNMGWLVVNNPNDASLSMDFSKPFGIISKYIAGKTGPAPQSWWEVNKWADYLMRAFFILLTAGVACFTVFIMQAMLIIQKLILVFSKLLVPIFIACLSLPGSQGSGQNFLKSIAGVMCWPVGWAIVHIGTMAALQALQPPSLNAQLGELLLSFGVFAVVCLWPVVGTIGAPWMIAKMVTSGTNFAHSMMGSFASTAGQHASRGLQAGGAVAGALVGGATAGPAGAAAGASWGSKAGGALALPLTSATESAEGVNEGRRPIPSSRSAAVADAAIGLIKARS
jgi:hypothetical protein